MRARCAQREAGHPRLRQVALPVITLLVGATALVLPLAASSAATANSAFSQTETITRTHVVNGQDQQADSRTVTLKIDRTQNLEDQQQLDVSWSGAHPTSNYYGDPNSSQSDLAEYPMVLLQCRGTAQTVAPETCWAPLGNEREVHIADADATQGSADDVGTFPAWRLDRYATSNQRAQFVGQPPDLPDGCPQSGAVAQRDLPFVAVDGTIYYGSAQAKSCGPPPPEAATYSDAGTVSNLPDNATFALTNADGSGEVKFSVRDSSTNASLGCSATVPCSLVAIPVMGISCDATLDTDDPGGRQVPDPQNPGQSISIYAPGRPDRAAAACQSGPLGPAGFGSLATPSLAVSGELWWSASNWRNRIVAPLTFAPASAACNALVNSAGTPALYGSETVLQATSQWSAKLCTIPGASTFDHVVSAEPLARSLVAAGGAEGAFTSRSPVGGFSKPTVQAPVAATGFAISYIIDGKDGSPYHQLKLTPRLLAKLMTESYADSDAVKNNYDALAHNPLNIEQDPEFMALNPGVPLSSPDPFGKASLFSVSTPSDVIYALTSYINADPEARAWLDGEPDPWGMVVNPHYEGIGLPLSTWPLADSWTMPPGVFLDPPAPGAICEAAHGVFPQPPYLQLIASPIESMLKIAQGVEYAQPGDGNACTPSNSSVAGVDGHGYVAYTRASRQLTGQRFVIGLTSLGDAEHYSLDTASLETASTVDPSAKFTDASGRTFVGANDDSLRAAFGQVKQDTASGGWQLDYAALRASVPTAYPGAMLINADIPTTGLPAADAAAYSSILKYIIGDGQVAGSDVGQLPDGYLPITAANGLSAEVAYTTEAAAVVAAQQGQLPGQSSSSSSSASSSSAPKPSSSARSTVAPAMPSSTPLPPTKSTPAPPVPMAPSATPSLTPISASVLAPAPATSTESEQPAALPVGKTMGSNSSAYQRLMILLLILLAIGPIGVPALLLTRRWRKH